MSERRIGCHDTPTDLRGSGLMRRGEPSRRRGPTSRQCEFPLCFYAGTYQRRCSQSRAFGGERLGRSVAARRHSADRPPAFFIPMQRVADPPLVRRWVAGLGWTQLPQRIGCASSRWSAAVTPSVVASRRHRRTLNNRSEDLTPTPELRAVSGRPQGPVICVDRFGSGVRPGLAEPSLRAGRLGSTQGGRACLDGHRFRPVLDFEQTHEEQAQCLTIRPATPEGLLSGASKCQNWSGPGRAGQTPGWDDLV